MTQQIIPDYERLIGEIEEKSNIAKNFENRISEIDVNDTLSMTRDIIDKYGPRLTGTKSTKQAAQNIHKKLSKHCDQSKIEKFEVHRESFLAFMKVFALSFVISSIFFFLGGIWTIIAVFGYTFATFFALLQFVLYIMFLESSNLLRKLNSG